MPLLTAAPGGWQPRYPAPYGAGIVGKNQGLYTALKPKNAAVFLAPDVPGFKAFSRCV